MIDTSALKGIIAAKGLSQRKLAKQLGMSEGTFYAKMKKGVFDSDEICAMIVELDIQNPNKIFFINLVRDKYQNKDENKAG